MKDPEKTTKKVRCEQTARLLLYLAAGFVAGLLAAQGLEWAAPARRSPQPILPVPTAVAVRLTPENAEKEKLNLNSATLEQLMELPGIGVKYAQAILDFREKHGDFHFIEEIMDVPGIGAKRFEALRPYITCGP